MTREGREAEAAVRERALAALTRAGEAAATARLDLIVETLTGLAHDADAVRERMISAGRRLLRLGEAAGDDGYRALLRAGLVPFSEAMASKLRAVARMVEGGLVPAERVPRAIVPAYAAARLPAPEVARLLDKGVLRPEATAREIRDAIGPPPPTRNEDAPLTKGERRRLERQMHRLLARVREIETRLARP